MNENTFNQQHPGAIFLIYKHIYINICGPIANLKSNSRVRQGNNHKRCFIQKDGKQGIPHPMNCPKAQQTLHKHSITNLSMINL